jgi:uncharacterized oligopeptide transporter (OPT) family protein
MSDSREVNGQKFKFLPPIGTPGYYVLLGAVAIFILGPLGGVTAAYMNFSLGFFIGGQVLAGILGSVVTLGYGKDGKHGANYMQTMAASVSGMAAMGVLIQAMVWLGLPEPPAWQLILYFLCIGMFGVGIGMLYTPILVDTLKLTYPSGLAVANILRALTDPAILKKSVGKLGGGIGGGIGISVLAEKVAAIGALGFSSATFGGGMIVGARISASAIVVAGIGVLLTPWLREAGYLGPDDPFRKIGFIFALGTILGAAIIDLSLLAWDFAGRLKRLRAGIAGPDEQADERPGQKTPVVRLMLWVAFWATGLIIVATQVLSLPVGWVLFAMLCVFAFLMINGISQGITDQNPISSAFVVTVLLMAGLGLKDPIVGLFAGSILLVSCTVGVDMQQDRSTGWRLGSDRNIQFRFQVIGVVMGAFLAVMMTKVFLESYPFLRTDIFSNPGAKVEGWQSAMTYKFVGVLKGLTEDKSKTLLAMGLGIVVGVVIQVIRKILQRSSTYQAWRKRSPATKTADFIIDALVLASPYASSFGGFVDFTTSVWFGLGGIFASIFNFFEARRRVVIAGAPGEGEAALPEDMSTTGLVGGGLIAGESLFALFLGLSGLIASGAIWKILGG